MNTIADCALFSNRHLNDTRKALNGLQTCFVLSVAEFRLLDLSSSQEPGSSCNCNKESESWRALSSPAHFAPLERCMSADDPWHPKHRSEPRGPDPSDRSRKGRRTIAPQLRLEGLVELF